MSNIFVYVISIIGMIEITLGIKLEKQGDSTGKWFTLAGGFILGVLFGSII